MTAMDTLRVRADSHSQTAFPLLVPRPLEGCRPAGTQRSLAISPRPERRAVGIEKPERAAEPRSAPRGPRGQLVGGSRFPREVVRADQRARLMRAVVAVVAARGYPAATVREVLWRAGVSQETLYAHFGGIKDALLTACDAGLDWVLGGVEEAVAAGRGRDRVREGLRCLLERFASEPELARCCFVEMCALGAPGEECRLRALERLAAALGLAIDARWDGGASIADEQMAGGVWHTIEIAVLARDTASLISLLPALDQHACAIATDKATATGDGVCEPPGKRIPVGKSSASTARNREIVDLRRRGLTLAEIGERFGLTRQRVAQIIDAAGRPAVAEVVAARHGRAPRGAETPSEEILERWRAGLTPAEIALKAELPPWAVRSVIEQRASLADVAGPGRAEAPQQDGALSDQAPMMPEHRGQGIAERRALVHELLDRGLSPSEIAVQLDSRVYTVYGDAAWLRAVEGWHRSRG